MKSMVQRILRKLGLTITRIQTSQYGYLLEVPRFKEVVVDLLGHDFKIADSSSFYYSFQEIFLRKIYRFESLKERPVILDCGSNYGTSIVYFKSLYPKARIIGVEADPKIFELLEGNIRCREYQDVALINKAVSGNRASIKFYRQGADGGRIFPLEKSKETVEVEPIHLDDLISEPTDFLKMDIEGAETNVICSCEKLKDVSQIFVEYHSFKDSEQTLSAILEKFTSNGFRYYIHTQFCSPRPLTEERLQLGMDLQLNIFAKRIA